MKPALTSSTDRKVVYSIQILRAVAALLVVCRHAAKEVAIGDPENAFVIGQSGVDIFFVISGFVIYLTGRNLSWGDFLKRRIARVVPLYWLALILAIAMRFLHHGLDPYFVSNAMASFLFIPAEIGPGKIFPPIVIGWTLNFEAFFYVLMALSLCLLRKRDPIIPVSLAIVALVVIGPGVLNLINETDAAVLILLLPISLEFVAGMWLARSWQKGFPSSIMGAIILGAIALAWFVLAPGAGAYTVWRPLYWGIPAVLIVAAALMIELKVDFQRWRLPLLLGDASYSIYIVHLLVFPFVKTIMHHLGNGLPLTIMFCAYVVTAITVGIGVHLLVELRLLKVVNRLLGLKRKTAHAGADSIHSSAAS